MKSYTVEYSETAEAELDAIILQRIYRTPNAVQQWHEGLASRVEDLCFMPRRFAVAYEQSAFDREVRALLYDKYRVLDTILDTDGDGEEDTVRILHTRHGAQNFLLPSEEAFEEENG